MEKGEASPYYGWFCFDKKMPYGYHTFGDWRYMPKLNLRNEACAQYFSPWVAIGWKNAMWTAGGWT